MGIELDISDETTLTKAQLLKGKCLTCTVELSIGKVDIRSLTIGEKAEAEAILVRDFKTRGRASTMIDPQLEGDADKAVRNSLDYKLFIAACGLSTGKDMEHKWSTAEVKSLTMSDADFDKLVEEIMRFSGLEDTAAKVARFRKHAGRLGNGAAFNDVEYKTG
jgi:hypothetical protein